jgi:hypothetical protein
MDPTKPVSLVDVSTEPATLTLGETTYTLRRLRQRDYAKAQQHMRDQALNAALAKLRTTPLDDRVVAGVIADICNKPISQHELWQSVDGETYMLFRGLQPENGTPGPTFEQVLDLPPVDRLVLTRTLLWICGIAQPEGATADPSIATSGTPAVPSDGMKPCPSSAPNSK